MGSCESPKLQGKSSCSKRCPRTEETKDLIGLLRCSGGTGRKQSFPKEPCLLAVNPLKKSRCRNNRLCSLRFSEEPGRVISMTFASRARPSSLRLTSGLTHPQLLAAAKAAQTSAETDSPDATDQAFSCQPSAPQRSLAAQAPHSPSSNAAPTKVVPLSARCSILES